MKVVFFPKKKTLSLGHSLYVPPLKMKIVNLEKSYWCLQFPPKNEGKQVNLRFHGSKVEFVCSFFGGNVSLKKSFGVFLTFINGLSNRKVELELDISTKSWCM